MLMWQWANVAYVSRVSYTREVETILSRAGKHALRRGYTFSPADTSCVTHLLAPITAPRPIVMRPKTVALE